MQVRCFAGVLALATLASCGEPSPEAVQTVYATEYGLGPDKWATAWLLTRRADLGSKLEIADADAALPNRVSFDHPSAAISRRGNRSAFEVARESFKLDDPTLDALTDIITDIEVNYWAPSARVESRVVEDSFRALQFRYGRDSVTPQCYVAFFDRVYQVLRDAEQKEIPFSSERLQMSCGELEHLAGRSRDLIPEVPIVDVLSAAAAGRKVVFVDVREADEYAEAHIPGALNIPIRDASPTLRERLRGADYVVSYCVKDFRGFEMAKALAQVGVENSVIMRPYGIKGWIASGLPVVGAKALTEAQAAEALQRCVSKTSECLTSAGDPI